MRKICLPYILFRLSNGLSQKHLKSSHYLNYILFVFLFAFFIQDVYGQRVQSQLDSTAFLIGDQSRLTIQGTFPQELESFHVSKATIDSTDAIEFVSQSPLYKEVVGSHTVYKRELLIAFFDTGAYYIPSIPISYEMSGTSNTIHTAPIQINVRSLQSDSTFVAPIKPIIKEAWQIWDAWPIIAAILSILILLGLIFYKRKKRLADVQVIEIPKTPYELAMIELNELEHEKFVAKGKLKEHYAQLSFILRSYLERQFEFPALESTTREIGYSLDAAEFEQSTKAEIIDRLQQIDLIKFAKVQPDLTEVEHAVDRLRTQIQSLNQLTVTSDPPIGEDDDDKNTEPLAS